MNSASSDKNVESGSMDPDVIPAKPVSPCSGQSGSGKIAKD